MRGRRLGNALAHFGDEMRVGGVFDVTLEIVDQRLVDRARFRLSVFLAPFRKVDARRGLNLRIILTFEARY